MTLEEFSAALDRFGAGIAGWPETEREAAMSLLAQSAQAQALLVGATRLEAFVQAHDPARAIGPDALARVMNGVMANLPRQRQRPTLAQWLGLPELSREWLPRFAVSMAAAALLGVIVGGRLPINTIERLSPIEALAEANSYQPLDLR